MCLGAGGQDRADEPVVIYICWVLAHERNQAAFSLVARLEDCLMTNSLYSFTEVEAKKASPSTLRDIIKGVLRAKDGVCYSEMEPYLMPPGVRGSRSFDQHSAVMVLMAHDAENKGQIATKMSDTPTLNHRALWDILQGVLRSTGFKMRHGRLIGLLEHQKPEEEENGGGQPDID